MVDYNKINVKLSNLQLSKLKTAVKNNEGTTLRISRKKALIRNNYLMSYF